MRPLYLLLSYETFLGDTRQREIPCCVYVRARCRHSFLATGPCRASRIASKDNIVGRHHRTVITTMCDGRWGLLFFIRQLYWTFVRAAPQMLYTLDVTSFANICSINRILMSNDDGRWKQSLHWRFQYHTGRPARRAYNLSRPIRGLKSNCTCTEGNVCFYLPSFHVGLKWGKTRATRERVWVRSPTSISASRL